MEMTKQQKEDIAETLMFTLVWLRPSKSPEFEETLIGVWNDLLECCGNDTDVAREIWDWCASSKEKRILDEYLKKKREA